MYENKQPSRMANRGLDQKLDLYQRSTRKKARVQNAAKEKRKELQKKEMEGVTFSPLINLYSRKMKLSKKPEERLLDHALTIQQKTEEMKSSLLEQSRTECTFTPQINPQYVLSDTVIGSQTRPKQLGLSDFLTTQNGGNPSRNCMNLLYQIKNAHFCPTPS